MFAFRNLKFVGVIAGLDFLILIRQPSHVVANMLQTEGSDCIFLLLFS